MHKFIAYFLHFYFKFLSPTPKHAEKSKPKSYFKHPLYPKIKNKKESGTGHSHITYIRPFVIE